MSKRKGIQFSFSIPITEILKEGSLFRTKMVGELIVYGTGRIDPEYPQPPKDAADLTAWVSIKFDAINYHDVDLRPVFNLPDAKPLMQMIIRAAENHCQSITQL